MKEVDYRTEILDYHCFFYSFYYLLSRQHFDGHIFYLFMKSLRYKI